MRRKFFDIIGDRGVLFATDVPHFPPEWSAAEWKPPAHVILGNQPPGCDLEKAALPFLPLLNKREDCVMESMAQLRFKVNCSLSMCVRRDMRVKQTTGAADWAIHGERFYTMGKEGTGPLVSNNLLVHTIWIPTSSLRLLPQHPLIFGRTPDSGTNVGRGTTGRQGQLVGHGKILASNLEQKKRGKLLEIYGNSKLFYFIFIKRKEKNGI